jgi:hypothetical protein
MGRRRRPRQRGIPEPLRWRPRVRVFGLVTGLFGGLGTVVLIQQYGVAPLTRALTLQGLIGGLLSGVIVPSVVYAVVVPLHNRKLRRLHGGGPTGGRPGSLAGAALFLVMAAAVLLTGQGRADAVVTGPCSAVFNGVDVGGLTLDASDAVPVTTDDTFQANLTSSSDVIRMRLGVRYAGFTKILRESEDTTELENENAGGGSRSMSFPIEDIAWLGAGVYEFYGSADTVTGPCIGSFLFDVQGDPLDTAIGKGAAAAAAIGAAGVAGMVVGGIRDGASLLGAIPDTPAPEPAPDPSPAPSAAPVANSVPELEIVTRLGQASTGLGQIADGVGKAKDVLDDLPVSDGIKQLGGTKLDGLKERVEGVKGWVDTGKEAAETIDQTVQTGLDIGLNGNQIDAMSYTRVVGKYAGQATQTFVNTLMKPFTSLFGDNADKVAGSLVPIGEAMEEVGKIPESFARMTQGRQRTGMTTNELTRMMDDGTF